MARKSTGPKKQEAQQILNEVKAANQEKRPLYKRLFKRGNTFVFILSGGTDHLVKIDPKKKIKSVQIEELEKYGAITVCSTGGNNLFSYYEDGDILCIRATVRTEISVIRVTVR